MKLSLLLALALPFAPMAAHADTVQALTRGDQSLAAFSASINGAKKSIDMATFVFEACDSVPKLLLDQLVRKAQSGVHVRLMIDAYSLTEPTRSSLPAYVAGVKNFELRYYNDHYKFDIFTTLQSNMRSHVKAFVVDGERYIVGGRNMQDDYFGLGSKMNYVDHDLLVAGSSAKDAQERYNDLWAAASKATGNGDPRAFAAQCLALNARDQRVAAFLHDSAAARLAARPQRSCAVEYVMDAPDFMGCSSCTGGGDDGNRLADGDVLVLERLQKKRTTKLFLDFGAGTEKSLELVNQYYMPMYRETEMLGKLRADRKIVSAISNATGDIDSARENASFTCYMQSLAVATSAATQRVSLLTSKGVLGSRWDLSVAGAPWRIHAKSAIRDGRDVLVSSFNMDPRSYSTNLESGAAVYDCPELAADLQVSYDELANQAATDKTCAACAADFPAGNQVAGAFCGGVPDLF